MANVEASLETRVTVGGVGTAQVEGGGGQELEPPSLTKHPPLRPLTRGDCINGPRPCPWRDCRYHLQHQDAHTGAGAPNKLGPGDIETCSLDVADGGEQTLLVVGSLLGVVRERVRQIETQAIQKLRRRFPDADVLGLLKQGGH